VILFIYSPSHFPLPELLATFPGVTGECSFRKVSAHFRDGILDDKSFFNDPRYARSGGVGMVQKTLTAPDWKPKVDPDENLPERKFQRSL